MESNIMVSSITESNSIMDTNLKNIMVSNSI